jgi:hypothetical protein
VTKEIPSPSGSIECGCSVVDEFFTLKHLTWKSGQIAKDGI